MKWISRGRILLSTLIAFVFSCGCCRQYLSSDDVVDPKFASRKEQIAPLFKYGDGYGLYGCSISYDLRPVFCKEDIAIDLIIKELGKAGIETDMRNVRIEGIKDFRDSKFLVHFYEKFSACDRWILDGYCSEYNIGFEFISKRDCSNLGFESKGKIVKVYSYDMIGASNKLRTMFHNYEEMTIGIFYDPVVEVNQWIQLNTEELNRVPYLIDESIAWKLRAQVQDFIAWLQREGYMEPEGEEGE